MKATLLDLETALITGRTVVRRFREQEGAELYRLYEANAQLLQDTLPGILPILGNTIEAEYFVRKQFAAWLSQEALPFAIWDKESARMVGYAILSPTDSSWRKVQFTGFIDKEKNGTGLMSEALQAILHMAFYKVQIEKVTLLVSVENIAAQRLARKCGLLREGDLREEFQRVSGEPVDGILFSLTRSTYEK